jgi:hypothetical protein
MNSIFFNKRIEGPFKETYKGYNQYIFTGDIDDLFLMDSSELGINRKLCRIEDAFAEYGKKEKYDIVITVKEDQNLSLATVSKKNYSTGLRAGLAKNSWKKGKKQRRSPHAKKEKNSLAHLKARLMKMQLIPTPKTQNAKLKNKRKATTVSTA